MNAQTQRNSLPILTRDAMLKARRRRDLPSAVGIDSVVGRFNRLSTETRIAIASALNFCHQLFADRPIHEALQLLSEATAKCIDEALVCMTVPIIVISGRKYKVDYHESWGHRGAAIWMHHPEEFNGPLSLDPHNEDVILMMRMGLSTLEVVLSITNEPNQYKYIDLSTGQLRQQAS